MVLLPNNVEEVPDASADNDIAWLVKMVTSSEPAALHASHVFLLTGLNEEPDFDVTSLTNMHCPGITGSSDSLAAQHLAVMAVGLDPHKTFAIQKQLLMQQLGDVVPAGHYTLEPGSQPVAVSGIHCYYFFKPLPMMIEEECNLVRRLWNIWNASRLHVGQEERQLMENNRRRATVMAAASAASAADGEQSASG